MDWPSTNILPNFSVVSRMIQRRFACTGDSSSSSPYPDVRLRMTGQFSWLGEKRKVCAAAALYMWFRVRCLSQLEIPKEPTSVYSALSNVTARNTSRSLNFGLLKVPTGLYFGPARRIITKEICASTMSPVLNRTGDVLRYLWKEVNEE